MLTFSAVLQVVALILLVLGGVLIAGIGGGLVTVGLAGLYVGNAIDEASG
jgi:hypothetical protein